MARKARIHFAGALYHVMCRGNQGQRIFKDNQDYQTYLEFLRESQKRFGYKLYAYVLMENHVHHLIEIGKTPLSKVMQNILFRYTRKWNRRYQMMGHLFQGRYKAILCDKESYLLELIRYIHLNPVRSKKVKDPGQYRWSSHCFYLDGRGNEWIGVEEVLPYFGKRPTEAISRYQIFVREGIAEGHRADLYQIVDQRYLGEEKFIERVEKGEREKDPARSVEIKWGEIEEAVSKHYGIPVFAMTHRGGGLGVVRARRMMAWVGREVGGMTNQEMGKELGQDASGISRGLSKLGEELGESKDMQKQLEALCDGLRKGKRLKRSITHD